jgi:hypothetical protein
MWDVQVGPARMWELPAANNGSASRMRPRLGCRRPDTPGGLRISRSLSGLDLGLCYRPERVEAGDHWLDT